MLKDLNCFWQPKSVVVVGASPKGGLGYNVLTNLAGSGVKVFAVNPQVERVGEFDTYKTLGDLPETPACAVFATRADITVELLKDAGEKGIKGAVVYASGFGEVASGIPLQKKLKDLVGRYGMEVCGPNCLGLIDFGSRISLLSSESAAEMIEQNNRLPDPRGVSIVSQSGGLLLSVYRSAMTRGLRISRAVSSGNEDVTVLNDYLEAFLDDEQSKALIVIAEAVRKPEQLEAVLAAAKTMGKPIVWLSLGRTASGAKAAARHTGAVVTPADIMDALFARFGIISVESIAELVEAAILSTRCPSLPLQDRRCQIAGLSITGGGAVSAVDWAERLGLEMADLSPATVGILEKQIKSFAHVSNPLDTGWPVMLAPDSARPIIGALIDDTAVDILFVVLPVPNRRDSKPERLFQTLAEFSHLGKPIVVISTLTNSFGENWHSLISSKNIAFLEDIGISFKALSSWIKSKIDKGG